MNAQQFKITAALATLVFLIVFFTYSVPAAIELGDIIGAFLAGFSNPFAAGYSTDVIACWTILSSWILYEAKTLNIKYGWVCILLGIIPGVALGFSLYLWLRYAQLKAAETVK